MMGKYVVGMEGLVLNRPEPNMLIFLPIILFCNS